MMVQAGADELTDGFEDASQAAGSFEMADICFHGATILKRGTLSDPELTHIRGRSSRASRASRDQVSAGSFFNVHVKGLFGRTGLSKDSADGLHLNRITDWRAGPCLLMVLGSVVAWRHRQPGKVSRWRGKADLTYRELQHTGSGSRADRP